MKYIDVTSRLDTHYIHLGWMNELEKLIKEAKSNKMGLNISHTWMCDRATRAIATAQMQGVKILDRTNERRIALSERNERVLENVRDESDYTWSFDISKHDNPIGVLSEISNSISGTIFVSSKCTDDIRNASFLTLLIMHRPDITWRLEYALVGLERLFALAGIVLDDSEYTKVHFLSTGGNILTLHKDENGRWLDDFGMERVKDNIFTTRQVPYEFGNESILIPLLEGKLKSKYWNTLLDFLLGNLSNNLVKNKSREKKKDKLLRILGVC